MDINKKLAEELNVKVGQVEAAGDYNQTKAIRRQFRLQPDIVKKLREA